MSVGRHGKGRQKKIFEVIVAEISQKLHENDELTYARNSMTPKHKKHKIILKYIIINSANTSDKEENLRNSQMKETTYI